MYKVFFVTFGCKVNQYETECLRSCFVEKGFVSAENESEADVFVVNSCTVTGSGDSKSLYAVRRLRRSYPRAVIALTGCLPQARYLTAPNGKTAVMEAASHNPDIILLDLGLPDMDGVEIIRKIRTWSDVPIIVISARSEDTDKIEALDSGADDYLTKPFSVDELLARIRVTQRRILGMQKTSSIFVNGDLTIDYAAGSVTMHQEEIHLTPIEYKILCLLAKNVGKVLTHTYITHEIWGSSYENEIGSLRVFMATLRKKLEKQPQKQQYIQTHIGIGYRMNKM